MVADHHGAISLAIADVAQGAVGDARIPGNSGIVSPGGVDAKGDGGMEATGSTVRRLPCQYTQRVSSEAAEREATLLEGLLDKFCRDEEARERPEMSAPPNDRRGCPFSMTRWGVTETVLPERDAMLAERARENAPLPEVTTKSVPALITAPLTGEPSSKVTLPEKVAHRAKAGAASKATMGNFMESLLEGGRDISQKMAYQGGDRNGGKRSSAAKMSALSGGADGSRSIAPVPLEDAQEFSRQRSPNAKDFEKR